MTISYLSGTNVNLKGLTDREYRLLKERGYTRVRASSGASINGPVYHDFLQAPKKMAYKGEGRARKADVNKKGYAGSKSKGQVDQMDYPPPRV